MRLSHHLSEHPSFPRSHCFHVRQLLRTHVSPILISSLVSSLSYFSKRQSATSSSQLRNWRLGKTSSKSPWIGFFSVVSPEGFFAEGCWYRKQCLYGSSVVLSIQSSGNAARLQSGSVNGLPPLRVKPASVPCDDNQLLIIYPPVCVAERLSLGRAHRR